jgi:hypothetical protein
MSKIVIVILITTVTNLQILLIHIKFDTRFLEKLLA